jgi:hypothetical protein
MYVAEDGANADEGKTSSILERFEFGEWVVDLLSGVLLLVLFGPFVYALKYAFTGFAGTVDLNPTISIFPEFLKWIGNQPLGTLSPWLFLGLAMVLGTASRGFLILYNFLGPARRLEKLIARQAEKQLREWHKLGLASDGVSRTVTLLIDENPFRRIGSEDYAAFRAFLSDRKRPDAERDYWYYELGLYLRSAHYFSLVYTFFWLYLIYGAYYFGWFYCHTHHLGWHQPIPWVALLFIVLVVLVGIFEEVIIHGVAFTTIDNKLYREWHQKQSSSPETKPSI